MWSLHSFPDKNTIGKSNICAKRKGTNSSIIHIQNAEIVPLSRSEIARPFAVWQCPSPSKRWPQVCGGGLGRGKGLKKHHSGTLEILRFWWDISKWYSAVSWAWKTCFGKVFQEGLIHSCACIKGSKRCMAKRKGVWKDHWTDCPVLWRWWSLSGRQSSQHNHWCFRRGLRDIWWLGWVACRSAKNT